MKLILLFKDFFVARNKFEMSELKLEE